MLRRRLSFSVVDLLPTTNTTKSEKNPRRSLAATLFPSSILRSRSSSVRRSISTQENYESVIFIWLNVPMLPMTNIIDLLRDINNSVQVYTDSSLCFEAIRSSRERIFFISSSGNNELITTVHDFPAVEAIFILDPTIENVKNNFPKLCGVFARQDELLREMNERLDVFEQLQFEMFVFEDDNIFLWRQLWREVLTNRKTISNKHDFVEAVRIYYQKNLQTNSIIDEFEKSYRVTDALNWCFRSPFPSRFLKHAICYQNKEQLDLARFLFVDATRLFQKHSEHNFSIQVFRGMKLSNEHIDRFEKHIDKLVCTSGFFSCTKSRTNALALALLPTYRPDLSSVLFEIVCESTDLFIEVLNVLSLSSSSVVFDVCMVFHVMYVSRGQPTIIKLKTAGEDGKQMAQNYLTEHNDETLESLLDQVLTSTKSLTSDLTRRLSTFSEPSSAQITNSTITADEWEARKHVDQGKIDLALIAYKRIHPVSARILNIIGQLCVDKKGDYDYAFEVHSQALKMQEQNGDDITETLTNLGNIHYHRRELDMALACHTRALSLRETISPPDFAAITISLLGISNTLWARHEYEEAIDNAEQALVLQERFIPFKETKVVKTLIMLGNIYQDCSQYIKALDRYIRALVILERMVPVDLHVLAKLYNNLGSIHQNLGATEESICYFKEADKIYTQVLPRDHSDCVSVEIDLEHTTQPEQKDQQDLNTYL